jgi:ubiquinone/menaquinone biosynthesis C-methylase UbiE
MESYNSSSGAQEYINFINSENGLIEQEVLYKAVSARLNQKDPHGILDCCCGTGWLTAMLAKNFGSTQGCDASPDLIAYAKKKYPGLEFQVQDATKSLPYDKEIFTEVVVNMAAHDLENQPAAFQNIFQVLQTGGKLILTIANPYYAYPVGVWKRGIWGRLLFRKPELKIRPYNIFRSQERKFTWGLHITPYFYPLSEQINNALQAGFTLTYFEDIKMGEDSKKFNLQYQLYRVPYMLLLEFKKQVS